MSIFLIAIAPILAIALFIYYKDKHEKEPIKILLLAFGLGVFSALPIIFVENYLTRKGASIFISIYQNAAWDAFVVAALTEEFFKFLLLMLVIWPNKNFNEKFDGIVYATMVSLGFAALENILYVKSGGIDVGVLRAFTAVPLHAVCGISMGFFIGFAKFSKSKKNKILLIITGLIVAILIHGVYNFIIMSRNQYLLIVFVPYILTILYIAYRKMNFHSKNSRFNNNSSI